MSEVFKVNVNNTFQFDFDNESISQLDSVPVEKNKFHILNQNKPFQVEIVAADFNHKSYTVKVNNNTYTVAISNQLDQLISAMGFNISATKKVNKLLL